jgi:hypothetical protein
MLARCDAGMRRDEMAQSSLNPDPCYYIHVIPPVLQVLQRESQFSAPIHIALLATNITLPWRWRTQIPIITHSTLSLSWKWTTRSRSKPPCPSSTTTVTSTWTWTARIHPARPIGNQHLQLHQLVPSRPMISPSIRPQQQNGQ